MKTQITSSETITIDTYMTKAENEILSIIEYREKRLVRRLFGKYCKFVF